jgi:nucleoside-diphosphate-sugar epimerase
MQKGIRIKPAQVLAPKGQPSHQGGMSKTLLSFGHGYCAQALAARLIPQGWRVIGTTRSADKAAVLRRTGVEPLVWPAEDSATPLDEATHLLISAGPDASGDPVLSRLGARIARIAPRLEWVGYLSTTAVYGDHGGGWVDEGTPPNPASARGRWRVEAENAWGAIPGLPLHIFRLAGIYGPGRGPFAKLRGGTARRIVKPGQVFSRIHVADVAQVLVASINHPNPGAIYNLCDDDPAPPQDVIAFAAELLGLPVPPAIPFDKAEMTPMARSFYGENKRVRNTLIKDELGVELIYPGYRQGLAAMVET